MKKLEWSGPKPDLLALKANRPDRYPAFFSTGSRAGWDILFAFPQLPTTLRVGDNQSAVADFFEQFPSLPGRGQLPAGFSSTAAFPFTGGWLLAFSYELGGQLEPAAGLPGTDDFPLAYAVRIPAAILFDREQEMTWLIAEPDYADCLQQMQRDLAAAPMQQQALPAFKLVEDDPGNFLDGVSRIKSYIHDGDVFQVNLSRGWHVQFETPPAPAALFQRLNQRNPAPFSAMLDMDGWTIVSSSPERLVRVEQNGKVLTRPIAGTHPRSTDANEDAALRQRLQSHPKERAEHIMLVDLERNDLGRVCEPGSVRVEALMELTSYAHVHHLESTVSGQLRTGTQLHELMRAIFPGGTITGCPKVRTMQIIRELEESPRRAYTGSLGYINLDGTLDLNILIRSFLLKQNQAWFRTGAGIVADSEPLRELAETRAKAKGLLKTLENGA